MSQHRFKSVLLTAPGCVHCAALKKILEKFLTEGLLGQLEVIDASRQPEIVKQYSIKSVPWLKLGVFEFSGAQREVELRKWIARLNTAEGITAYIKHLLATGELDLAIRLIRNNPEFINNLLALVADEDKEIKIQLGVSAIFEELEGSSLLRGIVEQLGELAAHRNPKIRADIAHFLSLCHHEKALGFLQELAMDSDREVREIANDALRTTAH
ncbi:MAG: thioredoxin family protein [Gammaproteobacteria bacterium]|nr:thioredoxin family protein [Gammaproteobacteria bacterium]